MVTAYPVKDKGKSRDLCRAFAAGCGGTVSYDSSSLEPGPAFFYGVDASNVHLWRQARAEGREYYYADNSYFDESRQQYFRITKNRTQHTGNGNSDGKRFASLGIPIKPWTYGVGHIVVCPQSDSFMENVVGYKRNWAADTVSELGGISYRPIRMRLWSANKGTLASTLAADLEGAYALVTWSSAAAVTALLHGVPCVVQGESAATPMCRTSIQFIHAPIRDERENWAGVLADNQFTRDEMISGYAWSCLK